MRLLQGINAIKTNANNLDPTKTSTLRKKMVSEMNARFGSVRASTNEYIKSFDDDIFEFTTDSTKLKQFNAWFQAQIDTSILSVSLAAPWTDQYITSSYKTATRQANTLLNKAGINTLPVDQALNLPINRDSLELLYTRTYSGLEAITDEMSGQMSRILASGFADGKNPNEIAREMSKSIDKITKKRARVLARTEIINAHANASLNNFEAAGVLEVEIIPEWVTAGDACAACVAMSNKTYTIESARGLIPLHPNCRCAWRPKVVRDK